MSNVSWDQAHRLIPSHYPPIDLYERIADPADWEVLFALESLTNDRLLDEVGDVRLVAPQDRVSGPGASIVMAAFTHIHRPSRFTDGSFGIYYAADSLACAIAETRYHRERFLAQTREPDTELTMRQYVSRIELDLQDIRAESSEDLYHPVEYSASQHFGASARRQGSNGLWYRSVRHSSGECVALFKPKATSIPIQGQHFRYVWNGAKQKIVSILCVTEFDEATRPSPT